MFSAYLLYVLDLLNKTDFLRGLPHSQEAQCNSCAQEKRNLPCQRPVEEEEGGEDEDNRTFDSR